MTEIWLWDLKSEEWYFIDFARYFEIASFLILTILLYIELESKYFSNKFDG